MNFFKKHKNKLIYILTYVMYLFIITILSYFKIISFKAIPSISLIFGCLIIFLLGFDVGKKREKKAYIGGLKLGLIVTLILFIINLIFFKLFSVKTIVYLFALVLSSIMGSILGINKKK